MKILFITEFFPKSARSGFTGGVEARAYWTVRYLKKKHQTKVISRQRTHVTATVSSIFSRLIFQLTAYLHTLNTKTDLIEGSNYTSYLPAFFSAKTKNVPAVAWFADVYSKTWFKNFSFITAVTGYIQESISLKLPWDHIIAMSGSTKKKLIQAGVPRGKVTVVYGGVNTKKISHIKAKKFTTTTICTAVRLVDYKRVQDLIKAVHFVNQKRIHLNLIIMGDGPQANELKLLTSKLNLNSRVIFTGNISQNKVLTTIKSSHLFCLPSVVEGFGLVTAEALAAGTPFISSDIPPTREITQNGTGGLLFKPKDPKDLSTKILKLLKNKKLYQEKRKQALKLAKSYDWTIISQQTEAVYSKLLE